MSTQFFRSRQLRRRVERTDKKSETQIVFHIERKSVDQEERTFPVVLSTDAPTARDNPFGISTRLKHTANAINLKAARQRGIPITTVHRSGGPSLPVGRIRDLKLADGKLRGMARLTRNAIGDELLNDVADGVLTDISVGADVEKWDPADLNAQIEAGTRTALRWTPVEGTLVATGADDGAGVHREITDLDEARKAAGAAAKVAELERRQAIGALFENLSGEDFQKLEREALLGDESLAAIQTKLIALLGKKAPGPVADGSTEDGEKVERKGTSAGEDALEKFRTGFSEALEFRSGLHMIWTPEGYGQPRDRLERERAMRENPFGGMSLADAAAEYLRVINKYEGGAHPDTMIGRAIVERASGIISHGPSDFVNLLADNVNKALGLGYEEVPESWRVWCGTGSIQDFKPADRPVLSTFGELDEITDDEDFTYGTFGDKKEIAKLRTFGKLFSIGRRAIVNDDLAAFGRIPRAMGRSATRRVGDLVYNDVLLFNGGVGPVMNEDGIALFDAAGHNNNRTPAAPSVDSFDAMRTAMALQRAPAPGPEELGAVVGVPTQYIIHPEALATRIEQLIASTVDAAFTATATVAAGTAPPQPPSVRRLIPVAEHRIDASGTLRYYAAASPAQMDTIVVDFLNGVQTPFLDQEEGFTRDGVTYKVRHDATATAYDWRGLQRTDNA